MKFLFSILALIFYSVSATPLSETACPNGWNFLDATSLCYLIMTRPHVFEKAEKNCIDQGGHLSTILSETELRALADMTSSLILSPWVGAKKTNGRWKFINGLYVLKAYWAPEEPTIYGECTSLRSINPVGLRATPCYSMQPAICKRKAELCNGGNFGGNSGDIESPGYPVQYYNNLDCYYTITTRVGTYISLTFETFRVEELHDFVEIYDGNSTESKMIGDLDSSITGEKNFKSTSNKILIYFHTDYKITDKGWRVIWTAVPKSNTILQNGDHGIITSPNYPNDYDPFAEQIYNISVKAGSQINVTFDVFQTESNNDYLEIYNSSQILPAHLIANLSGQSVLPRHMTSGSNNLIMRFITDGDTQYPGWHMMWNMF